MRYEPDKHIIAKIREVTLLLLVIELLFLHSALSLMALYQTQGSFNSLLCFQRYAADKLFIAKINKGSNTVNTGDRVMLLAFATFSDGPLSIYQVSSNSFLYLKRYAPDKLFIVKTINYVNPGDRVMVLAFCSSPNGPLPVYQVALNGKTKPVSQTVKRNKIQNTATIYIM